MIVKPGEVTLIPTGLKVYMPNNQYLALYLRSSTSIKNASMMINSTGVIDSDYYNNSDNEGHMMIAVYNLSDMPYIVNKGDRIAQGIFFILLSNRYR